MASWRPKLKLEATETAALSFDKACGERLGVFLQDGNGPCRVQVHHISEESPAHAHLSPGDILLAVNGVEVRDAAQGSELIVAAGGPSGCNLTVAFSDSSPIDVDAPVHNSISQHPSAIMPSWIPSVRSRYNRLNE